MNATLIRRFALCAIAILTLALIAFPANAARLKDVAHVDGVRDNALVGYGLVVGLDGTGDTKRVRFTQQSIAAMLSRMGIRVDPTQLQLRNVAAVMVTATLPPFAAPGSPLDITVSALGDARSLNGGTLLMTPLAGADAQTYALAQGPVLVGGFQARGRSGSRVSKNHLNVGRIPGGARVERSVPITLAANGDLVFLLHRPDFTTAARVVAALNKVLGGGDPLPARAESAARIVVTVPDDDKDKVPALIAKLEIVQVAPDERARVVVNGRTGTIVVGGDVRLSSAAVAHGGLQVEIRETPRASQPNALAGGTTATVQQSEVTATEDGGKLKVIGATTTLAALATALNELGATPRDLIAILEALEAAGALQATLEVL